MTSNTETLEKAFSAEFARPPRVFARAPGRVNLIGEHTDYNEGFVFPIALEFSVSICASPADSEKVRILSLNFGEREEFLLSDLAAAGKRSWSAYIRGVLWELGSMGHSTGGFDAVIWGNVPIGSGLSSSAALEVAAALCIEELFSLSIPGHETALLCQRAEHRFAGVHCGIMDQFIAVLAEAGHGLLIDCRTLEYQSIPVNTADCSFIICDSRASRELAASAYNERRRECGEGVRLLSGMLENVRALRDVSTSQFSTLEHILPDPIKRRCRHVITENERTLKSIEFMKEGNMQEFGRLMSASHHSLKDDYEVSSPYLDELVRLAMEGGDCLGSRMTGAGFGGCTVSLVKKNKQEAFMHRVRCGYREKTGIDCAFYEGKPSKGAEAYVLGAASININRDDESKSGMA